VTNALPAFTAGLDHFGAPWPDFDRFAARSAIADGATRVADAADPAAIYQTALAADALRFLTLLVTGAKQSGHPGGFASCAEAYAALVMLGHRDIVTEVGHHAPGFYSALFLDGSLEAMGILTAHDFRTRFRERHGLLGHLSGAIPGILAPAGPLGQGQHFAMAGALLHPDRLFAVTIGDGGLGEPYILSAFQHFATAYPSVTNLLPVLVWNGYSQEHHSMVSTWSNDRMSALWTAHGFDEVILIDAKAYDDTGRFGDFADATQFGFPARLAFTAAILDGVARAAKAAMSGRRVAFVIKQLKGAGLHVSGAKAHNLHPGDSLDKPAIHDALARLALPEAAWPMLRDTFRRAGGGPAGAVAVTETVRALPPLGELPLADHPVGDKVVPSTAVGLLAGEVGKRDPAFVVTNADGNEASGMGNINVALGIRHPTPDALYHQRPDGQVYEPLNEDACAGLAAGLALFGGRSLWLSYESFAINGWPIVQTVTQAMAELRRPTPSLVCLFTAGALEQGRNGWTHQRPEIEAYAAAMMRNGNFYPLYPSDANMAQAALAWALETRNKGIALFAAKSPLPIRVSLDAAKRAIEEGAIALYEGEGTGPQVVFAVAGDLALAGVFAARDLLEAEGKRVRIVAVVNPRRLFRPGDVAWESCSEADGRFLADAAFNALFDGDILIGVSGGAAATLEPVMLRSRAARRDLACWQRGETTAGMDELLVLNGLDGASLAARVRGA
jgi:phosphoketolase